MNVIYRDLLQETVAQYFVVAGAYENPGDSRSTEFVEALSRVSRIALLSGYKSHSISWLGSSVS